MDKQKLNSDVYRDICVLTQDDDERQELYLHYLSGHDSLHEKAKQIRAINEIQLKIDNSIVHLYTTPPPERFNDFMAHFSELERHILHLMLLGLSTREIATYQNISIIRLAQLIYTISLNSGWKTLRN